MTKQFQNAKPRKDLSVVGLSPSYIRTKLMFMIIGFINELFHHDFFTPETPSELAIFWLQSSS